MNGINVINFDSFGVERIQLKVKRFIEYKNLMTSVYRIQAYDSIMWGYFCNGLIDFMLKGKSLLNHKSCFLLIIMKRMIKQY